MLHVQHPEGASLTLVASVMMAIEERIASRMLSPGARLPSVRSFASRMSVSKSTVVEAYDRLAATGAIVARRGSGFFVAGPTRPLSLQAVRPQLDRAIDPLWLTRQSLQAGPDTLKPGSGWLPPSFMPEAALQRGLRATARAGGPGQLTYDTPLGYAPLRQQLVRRLGERGVTVEPDGIVLTDSATQSLDLLCRFLLQPGDTVVVDDPCYFNFHALLLAHRVRVVGVPYTPTGPDLDQLAKILAVEKPRFYLTISAIHNPTGATLAPVVAHRVLKLVEQYDTLIVEDDTFADIEPEPAPRLAGFDGLNRVVQIGGFSKTISSAIRCGYIAARGDWIDPLVDLKLATNLGNGHLAAVLINHLLADGSYRRHLEQVRRKLSDAMGQTLHRLGGLGLETWTVPRGGQFLWAQLPGALDAARIARYALERDVIVAPGNVFSVSQSASSFMRFNVARCAEPRIFEVLQDAMIYVAKS